MFRSIRLATSVAPQAASRMMPAAAAMHRRQLSAAAAAAGANVTRRTATLFPGDGIGPEIAVAVQKIFEKAGVPIDWEIHHIGTEHVKPGSKDLISPEALESVRRNGVGLKGPLATPIGGGHRSLNLTMRRALQLYANVRPCLTIPGAQTRYNNVDLVTIRENTEGEYSGLEHEAYPGVVENLKVTTRTASMRIAEFAFRYADKHSRRRVTAAHKANIQKMGDGMFLECVRQVAARFPHIAYEELTVDNLCLKLVREPSEVDVMVMGNLYGDIVSDLTSGLVGGLGVTASGNIGMDASVFEAVHGTAPDIAGKDLANPTALLLSSVMMLRHMGLDSYAARIEKATLDTIASGEAKTGDLGGKAKCSEFTAAICSRL